MCDWKVFVVTIIWSVGGMFGVGLAAKLTLDTAKYSTLARVGISVFAMVFWPAVIGLRLNATLEKLERNLDAYAGESEVAS